MNQELFNEFMKPGRKPSQNMEEWRAFLEYCEMYLKKHGIEKPVVVELGIWKNAQKKFYEELLGASHISIDLIHTRGNPDILGDTHDPETMNALKAKLEGRPINILFIDAGHGYEDVKKDFYSYSPLVNGIIAFHDIQNGREWRCRKVQVWKFWDELKALARAGRRSYKRYLFIDIYKYRDRRRQMGIGILVRQ